MLTSSDESDGGDSGSEESTAESRALEEEFGDELAYPSFPPLWRRNFGSCPWITQLVYARGFSRLLSAQLCYFVRVWDATSKVGEGGPEEDEHLRPPAGTPRDSGGNPGACFSLFLSVGTTDECAETSAGLSLGLLFHPSVLFALSMYTRYRVARSATYPTLWAEI